MTKELMDNILKDVFAITFDNSNESNLREIIKDVETYYGDSSYIYYSFSNDGILLVCDKRFDFYIDVLKKAINSKDKMLLDYIICSINGKSREDIRKHFIGEQKRVDYKEEEKKPSNTSIVIDRKILKEIMDSRQWWFKNSELAVNDTEKSGIKEANIQYFIEFVKNSKDILKKCGYSAYARYYAKEMYYGVTPDTFDLFEDFDKNIRKMYSYLLKSNDTSVIDIMDKYCDEILHKYGAKKEKNDIKKIIKNKIQDIIDINLNPDITAPVKIYRIKNIIIRTHKDASSFSNYPDELDWLMYHMNLITGVITFNCDKLSSIDRVNVINSICNNMLNLLQSDKFPNKMIEFSERDFIGMYLFKKEMESK
jgi:hypothetical protein